MHSISPPYVHRCATPRVWRLRIDIQTKLKATTVPRRNRSIHGGNFGYSICNLRTTISDRRRMRTWEKLNCCRYKCHLMQEATLIINLRPVLPLFVSKHEMLLPRSHASRGGELTGH